MLATLALKPGLMLDESPLTNEGGYTGGDRVRFRNGRLRSIGGWQPLVPHLIPGTVRGAHDWSGTGARLLAFGTETTLWVLYGGALIDITPHLTEGVLTAPFTTVSGSNTVTVHHPHHGLISGDVIVFSNASPIASQTLNGSYEITRINGDSYSIQAPAPSASLTSGPADTVDYVAGLPPGRTDGYASGWGTNAWNLGAWGLGDTCTGASDEDATGWGLDAWGASGWGGSVACTGAPSDPELRIWSFDNMGPRLVANPRGRGVYEWSPVIGPTEAVIDGIFSDASAWTCGSGWSVSGGSAVAVAGELSSLAQATSERLEPGTMYRVTFEVTVTAGSVSFGNGVVVDGVALAVPVGEASTQITRSGSYSRLFRATGGIAGIGFLKDALFAGTIDNLSIRQEARAYQVKGAPKFVDWIFVDPARTLVALACEGFDGTYNALMARWSALEDIEDWTPLDSNISGELPVAGGSRLMTGCNVRQANLLLSDTTAFRFQFTGGTTGFAQQIIGTGCGVIGRNALVEYNGTAYWMSPNGFFQYTGGAPEKIACPMEKSVIRNLPTLQNEKIYAGVNPNYNEIWWLYPDARDGIECSRAVVYNFLEKVWTVHTLRRTCWVAEGLFERSLAFATDGFLFEHELGTNGNGAPIDWWAETAPMDVEDGENLELITGLLPDVKDQIGDVTYSVWTRLYPQGPDLPPDTRVAAPGQTAIRFRRKGRQCRFRISSASPESFFQMGAPKLDLAKAEAKN